MQSDPLYWSAEKLQRLQEKLVDSWAEDVWVFTTKDPGRRRQMCRFLRFASLSSSLGTELKYALWTKFDSGRWSRDANSFDHRATTITFLIQWLDRFTPPVQSLMERDLAEWETLLQSHLLSTGRFRRWKDKRLLATQEYAEYTRESRPITLFRQLYSIIQSAYDERPAIPETEKDIWDLRRMGLPVNLVSGEYLLNFTLIAQPWLRHLCKEFMKFNSGIHSAADCRGKLTALRTFSRFLAECHPTTCISDIDRALIVEYISYLREHHPNSKYRLVLLSHLRTVLETCAEHLHVEGLTRKRLIFTDDFPKDEQLLPREIPEDVLKQLRKHLETLPTATSRMVVILLECGLRISELCTLPLDCLVCDDRHDWYLRFYQGKSKREHIIPLVNMVVIGTIQAQQEAVREQWGEQSPYLFPSPVSPGLPYRRVSVSIQLNKWAIEKDIRDAAKRLYRFQTHQFRHSVGMRLINDDIPLEVISRLLGHRTLGPTRIYATKRAEKLREELERVYRKKTVNGQGAIVAGAIRANDQEGQVVGRQMRGQTLPNGNCGRPLADGDCAHANKCLTCTFWLTSTEDLPRLKAFYGRAIRLMQRAVEVGNEVVIRNQERIVSNLAVRIARLEDTRLEASFSVEDLLEQLRSDLAAAESAQEEAREAGRLLAAKGMERIIVDLKASLTALEGTL